MEILDFNQKPEKMEILSDMVNYFFTGFLTISVLFLVVLILGFIQSTDWTFTIKNGFEFFK